MRPRKIFIVDDDLMITEALSDYLTREVPHQITIFPTGEECLKHLHENPEVIILDYFLDSVNRDAANGMEILQQIRKSQSKASVIMLSSQERYSVAAQTLQKGAEQYVIKDLESFSKIADIISRI